MIKYIGKDQMIHMIFSHFFLKI